MEPKPYTRVSKRFSYCTRCNRVWEVGYQYKQTLYYRDFPTYKLKRKLCEPCALSDK